ncbi:B12-binding domain-containing radical SAM protein [Thermoactinomyces mirandus]|uniref:B12-binding domain-containing radical SAM protein n=1 Tax=Thermoactinomyces mirandus TaxID=2756294 RepID=A0A7W1XSU7_9BACL|nr:B12-binding domain-containing radical SAM protein [Thermoactinomyces mirandus]MBA4602638.1 B12-binding domain-containing radical SAM protein [Thermoactinomyces mirandus]
MKVVLSTLNAKFIHTALSLRLLKAYCNRDFAVEMAEYTIKDPAMTIVSDLFSRRPDVIGFSCYIWNIEKIILVIDMLKKVLPEVKIVLGGPEVSHDTKYWMERIPQVDFIVYGEGEQTFHQLLSEMVFRQQYDQVLGLAYRNGEEIVINPPRPQLNLDEISSPYRFKEDLPHLANRVVYFETSRGCPFTCQFCLSSTEVGVRFFDIERVKEDLLYLIENGARIIKFLDRTFNINRDYALEIFQFLIDHHQGCVFQFEITADIMRPEVLDFLTKNSPPGIFRFEIGVQSTNDVTNKAVKRRQNFARLAQTVTRIKESGRIAQHLDLIAGLPFEDYERFRITFNDVFALEPEEMQLGFLKMLRGTGLREQADQYDYVYMEQAPYEVLGNRFLSFEDIVRIKRVEDVLEKYWNAHRMDHTIRFLIQHEFPSAFDFFQEFGDYWEQQGWQRIGHQLEDLFVCLLSFLKSRHTRQLPVILGLMKYDYYLNHQHRPRKVWWDWTLDKKEQSAYLREALQSPERVSGDFREQAFSERQLFKHAVIEQLPFDLKRYLESGEIIFRNQLLLACYEPGKKVKIYTMNPQEIL